MSTTHELEDAGMLKILPRYYAWANELESRELSIFHFEDDLSSDWCDDIIVVREDWNHISGLIAKTTLQIEKWNHEDFYRVKVKKFNKHMINQKPQRSKVKKVSTLLKYLNEGLSNKLTLLCC